jgi:hypothetical protein
VGLPDSGRISRVPPYSGIYIHRLKVFAYGAFTLFSRPSQFLSANFKFFTNCAGRLVSPSYISYNTRAATVQALTQLRFRLFPFRSPLLGESRFDFYSSGYLDGSVPRVFLCMPILFNMQCHTFLYDGLPHSVICGSQDVCSSPQLFAAYHDLLRQTAPRHPP